MNSLCGKNTALLRFPCGPIRPVENLYAAFIKNFTYPVRLGPVLTRTRFVPEMDKLLNLLDGKRDLAVRQPALFEPFFGPTGKQPQGPAYVIEGVLRRGQNDKSGVLLFSIRLGKKLIYFAHEVVDQSDRKSGVEIIIHGLFEGLRQ